MQENSIDLFEQGKNIESGQIFRAAKSSVEGREKTRLIPSDDLKEICPVCREPYGRHNQPDDIRCLERLYDCAKILRFQRDSY